MKENEKIYYNILEWKKRNMEGLEIEKPYLLKFLFRLGNNCQLQIPTILNAMKIAELADLEHYEITKRTEGSISADVVCTSGELDDWKKKLKKTADRKKQ